MSNRCQDCYIRRYLLVSIASGTVFYSAFPATAEPQGSSREQNQPLQNQSNIEQESPEYNGGDITRPQNQLDVQLQYRTSSQPDTQTQQERTLLRVTSKLKLDAGWRVGLFAPVPLVNKRTTTLEPSDFGTSASSENKFGIGDAEFQAYLAHDLDQNWAFGFGARGVGPSAPDALGSGKWQIMPGFGVRYSFINAYPVA